MRKRQFVKRSSLSTLLILYNVALILSFYAIIVITKALPLLISVNLWFILLAVLAYWLSCFLIGAVLLVDYRFYRNGYSALEEIWLKK